MIIAFSSRGGSTRGTAVIKCMEASPGFGFIGQNFDGGSVDLDPHFSFFFFF
jgi:hypothetical protein